MAFITNETDGSFLEIDAGFDFVYGISGVNFRAGFFDATVESSTTDDEPLSFTWIILAIIVPNMIKWLARRRVVR